MTQDLLKRLSHRAKNGNLRHLDIKEDLIDFSSNDYLGLARCAFLKEDMMRELAKLRDLHGSTGSRLLSGNTMYAEDLESALKLPVSFLMVFLN